MKRLITISIIGILVLSGLGATAIPNPIQKPSEKTETISFASPEIKNKDEYILVTIKNSNAWLYKTDAPMLPASITTYILPFGTKIRTVDVAFSEPEEYTLEKKIVPTPKPVSLVAGTTVTYNQDEQQIGSIYPETLFDYHLGAGISGEDHVIFVTVRCFPIQYKPEENKILYRNTAHLSITYELPTTVIPTNDEYKLIIIAPEDFSAALQPLVNHKISKGVTTKLVTPHKDETAQKK
jgi:hypothetical protein